MAAREDTLVITVTVRVSLEGCDVNRLETACWEASREALRRGVREAQEFEQRRSGGRWERREWKGRYLVTRLGRIRLEMLKVRDRHSGRSHWVGNVLLGLVPRQRMTRWVERQGLELRVRGLSYRQSAAALEAMDIPLSAMALWRRAQSRGAQCCALEAAEQVRLFEHPASSAAVPPAYLYLEADEIHVAAQRSAVDTHRIKTGVSYTGRERVAGYHAARYRLAGKRLYGGVEDWAHFGNGWYTLLERHYALSRTRAVLYLTDGDPGLVALRDTHFPHAIHAHDRAHVFRDLGAAAPDEACRKRWTGWLCEGRWDHARLAMRQCLRRGSGSPDALLKVLRVPRRDFYGTRLFRKLYDPQRTQRLPYATGGVEKAQEITIARAMKRRGMAWTARGAHHLAKLIFAFHHPPSWSDLWMEPPP